MKRNSSWDPSITQTLVRGCRLGLLLAIATSGFAISGCATAGPEGTKVSSNSSEPIGPDYYSSDDNPFHAD
jgi:hypothetical protein